MPTYTKRPGKIVRTPGYTCGSTDYRYKCWDDLDNLKTGGTAASRRADYQYPYIAGKNGTYKQAAPLDLTEFGFEFAADEVIDQIDVTYSVQTFINEGYYPSFEHPVVSLLNTTTKSQQANEKITGTKVTRTHTWYNVPTRAVTSDSFGVRFWFDQNRNTTPSRIELSDVKIVVSTTDYTEKIELGVDAPNKLTVGITTEVTCKIEKTSEMDYFGSFIVDLPFGVELVGEPTRVDGDYGVEISTHSIEGNQYQSLYWMLDLPDGHSTALLQFKIKAITPSATFTCSDKKRITELCLYEEGNRETRSYSALVNVTQIEAVVQSNFVEDRKSIRADIVYDYKVKVYSNDPTWRKKVLHLKYETGMDVITNLADILALNNVLSATYNSGTGEYEIVFSGVRMTNLDVPVSVVFDEAGEYDFKAWMTIQATGERISPIFERSCVVLSTNFQKLGFTRLCISDYADQMADGIEYTLGSLVRIVRSEKDYEVFNFGNNYRIGVYNGGAEDIGDDVDFAEHVHWAEKSATTKLEEQTVNFTYNSNEPLYIVWSHTYTADATGPYITVNFSEPILAESSVYKSVLDNTGISLKPVINTILNSDYATAKLTNKAKQTNRTAIDEWQDGGLFDRDISILGMEVTFDYEVTHDCSVEAELYVNGKLSGSRDILIYKGKGTGTVGSIYDLFGLSPSDLINRNDLCINPFEIRFFVSNPYMAGFDVKIRNVVINIEYIQRSSCQYGFTLDGEYSKDYGIILSEVTHNRGTKNDKSLYHVEGTDETIVNRLNVDSKDIELSIALGNSCEYEDLRHIIDRIVELFTNDRYIHSNKPIPKRLVFDHMPDRYYEVVRVEDFDDEFDTQIYKAKIKLLVPQGTTYDLQETITGKHGYSPSSVTIRPYITYISNTAGYANIYEDISMQSFTIHDTRITQGVTINIDCENRRVYLGNEDITEGVNYNSMWFRLRGEYDFNSETGNVVKVEYHVRRG